MITKWKLFNFKSVRRETELELGPLTIFAGANSSGKSTLIQSILLISQTLASKISSRSVVLNGHLTKLGQFDDLRSFESEADQILIGWECRPLIERPKTLFDDYNHVIQRTSPYGRRTERLDRISCDISFDVNDTGSERELVQLQPSLFSCQISCVARTSRRAPISSIDIRRTVQKSDKILELEVTGLDRGRLRTSLDYDVKLDDESLKEMREDLVSLEPVGCVLRHFLPSGLTVRFDQTDEETQMMVSAICDIGMRPVGGSARILRDKDFEIPSVIIDLLREYFGETLQPILDPTPPLTIQEWYERWQGVSLQKRMEWRKTSQDITSKIYQSIRSRKDDQYALRSYSLPIYLRDASDYIDTFFSQSVKYLGPLRDEPKALYPLVATVDPTEIGLRGEHTAAVLDLHKKRVIEYLPSANFATSEVKQETYLRSLETAVLDWLKYMGVVEGIETLDRGKLGHELKVTTAGVSIFHDLTHVGVGVSQVLPILVMCFLAERDTTLILEQPELHLHPRVQTLLGDFFLSMALLGKQCIIETHSEYLINRLRFRAAAAKDDALSSVMKVYFVEKKEGASVFRDVVVNKYGAIIDWPEGFFDQSQDEAEKILRAATMKRKQERTRKDNDDAQRDD